MRKIKYYVFIDKGPSCPTCGEGVSLESCATLQEAFDEYIKGIKQGYECLILKKVFLVLRDGIDKSDMM